MNIKVWEYIKDFVSKYKYTILICILGLLFASVPSCGKKPQTETRSGAEDAERYISADELAEKMAGIFSQIKGVGDARVVLTLKSGYETVYVFNEDLRSDRNDDSYESSRQKKLATITVSGNEEAIYSKIEYPQFLGALVVCDGGNDPYVQYQLTKAVSSLTGLSSDKIVIAKMK